jgi:hypothetical protein
MNFRCSLCRPILLSRTHNARCRHDVHHPIAESLQVCWLQELGASLSSSRDPTFCIPLLLTLHCCNT